jgi:shikimate 5-dehydrogenase
MALPRRRLAQPGKYRDEALGCYWLIGANITRYQRRRFADALRAADRWLYHLMDVDRLPDRRLPQLLDAINVAGFAGANITYPLSRTFWRYSTVDPEAAQVGAVTDRHDCGWPHHR